MPKFYLTTPIYYVNARPHIGHAYTTLAADTIARRKRLLGDDTFLLTGTDEHGQKIERSSSAAGVPPQQFADKVSASFQELWCRMGITNDAFIRTTSDAHKRGAQKLFRTLYDNGQIFLSSYTGQYSIGEEMFIEGPPGTIGPDGKPTETVTEENFFFRLSEFQLALLNLIESDELRVAPESRKNEVLSFLRGNVAGLPRRFESEEAERQSAEDTERLAESRDFELKEKLQRAALHVRSTQQPFYFEPMTSSQRRSLHIFALQHGDLYTKSRGAREERAVVVYPRAFEEYPARGISEVANDEVRYTALGHPYRPGSLRDLSVSRSSFTWGIPVPEQVQRAAGTTQPHVIYVWLDALANYMTALGYGTDDPALFEKFWPADLHLVGKEIIRFHCVYWPAFLLAAGIELPKAVTAHGWLLFDDSKMSKSKGNIVRTETILDAFGEHVYKKQFPDSTKQEQDLFATDVLRYFLLREIPFGQDGSFSFDAMWTRYNSELTNGYGNLVSRTLSMIEKYFGGYLPDFPRSDHFQLLAAFRTPLEVAAVQLSAYNFSRSLELIAAAVTSVDAEITAMTPWKIAASIDDSDTGQARRYQLAQLLCQWYESIRAITSALYSFLPDATAKVWQQLGLGDIELAAKNGELTNLQWGGLQIGTKLGPLSPIFPRADKGLAQIMIDMEAKSSKLASQQVSGTVLIEETASTPEPQDTNHPGAGPRTATLLDSAPGTTVGGSNALTTERTHTSHTEAAPSGIFAGETATPQIAIDDFVKVDLRVAQIVVAERIPKADKLLRLEVDLGYERRQILSGIAEWYTPEELLGRRIVIIANLAPRKMRGLESHGMLLAASSGENTKPILTTFGEDIALGSRVR